MGRTRPGDAGAKVLQAASALFYRDGIHAVGVDTVAAEAGVTKAALYGNFGSKSRLVVAYLRERDRQWQEEIDRITAAHTDPRERVLAVFDAYEAWLSRDGYRGCAFLNATSEFPDPADPVREVVRHHKTGLHSYLRAQLRSDEGELADELMLLLDGATVTAVVAQNSRPFDTAKRLARTLIA
ncbi:MULTISPECIES: TetR/AcrR family transcriptional regulator [unclassified Amycolatopsis]|uniref:TetR/AcrR family transcriptional regulator n=1 Tax=unclassified Amycolatopsis TaxID=2618356 RepID=UPI0028749D90|nr:MULTISPECIES: TetR/AcrR family transcriptional regulator [unclassified Amycolatopsis]MDS0138882.1 TetR/AcrR family transcriptional regulator [Amycolatopsis sp. 505]MDS0147554.1 TetR/AcrR family transcriptional regulator [Amycolatopsis sp. CM201R]